MEMEVKVCGYAAKWVARELAKSGIEAEAVKATWRLAPEFPEPETEIERRMAAAIKAYIRARFGNAPHYRLFTRQFLDYGRLSDREQVAAQRIIERMRFKLIHKWTGEVPLLVVLPELPGEPEGVAVAGVNVDYGVFLFLRGLERLRRRRWPNVPFSEALVRTVIHELAHEKAPTDWQARKIDDVPRSERWWSLMVLAEGLPEHALGRLAAENPPGP